MKKKPAIVCRGYGSPHGYAKGRLWFVCSKCRWSTSPAGFRRKLEEQTEIAGRAE